MQNVLKMQLARSRQLLRDRIEVAFIERCLFLPAQCRLGVEECNDGLAILAHVRKWPIVFRVKGVRKLLWLLI